MRYILLLLIANSFWAAPASAQGTSRHHVFGRYQQLTWGERDGLPQNTVLAIATTRDGYLWLGTYEGAARFDGVRFTLFNPSTTTGIGNALVTALLERRDGDLWLATSGGGVSRRANGQFTQYAAREGLSSDFATCLFEDRTGTLWIGTDGGGVNAFSQGRFTPYTIAQGLPSNLVRAIIDDGHGGLLVGTDRGIARIADGRVSALRHARTSRRPTSARWLEPRRIRLGRRQERWALARRRPRRDRVRSRARPAERPPDQEITIYRIIQESVNNVIKHARAREAYAAARSHEHHVEITIRDDGQGFASGASTAGSAPGGGFGLTGLAERVQMLGGTHTIDSAPGRGTTVTVRIGVGARGGTGTWRAISAS